jgi:hypothetical protein
MSKPGDPQSRNLNDKNALQAKIEAKKAMQEQLASQGANPSKGPVKPKPKKASEAGLDDLLNAGLGTAKKK